MTDPGAPATRGRRDPEVAARIQAGRLQATQPQQYPQSSTDLIPLDTDGGLDDPGQQAPEELPLVLDGDVIQAKVTHTVEIDGQPSWFAYGLMTRVRPGETETEAFERVAIVVNERVLDMAADAEDRIDERARLRESQSRRITTRRI